MFDESELYFENFLNACEESLKYIGSDEWYKNNSDTLKTTGN